MKPRRARLATLGPMVRKLDTRVVPLEPKRADPHYSSPEHKAWRDDVLRRADFRCEAIEDGMRCRASAPTYRMYADHIVERADGGADLDLDNGQCLCPRHHTLKTHEQRDKRMTAPLA